MNTILIVDSDKKLLNQIQTDFAESKQYRLMTASNAKSAVDALNKTDIAALISGMKLFGFSGIELIAYMTRMFPSTPCIALLDPGQPTPYFTKSAKTLPVLQFLEKPVEHKKLAAMIEAGIRQKNQSGPAAVITLENFLPLIVNNHRTCQVDIKTDRKKKGSLYFAQGELIDARWEKKSGENAVYEMLSWEGVKISVSALPVNKKQEKIHFDLMEKIGVSWDKPDKPIQVADGPIPVSGETVEISDEAVEIFVEAPEDHLPDADIVKQLEQSLEKNINVLKTVKGFQGIAILTPGGQPIVSNAMDDLTDVDHFSADFAAVFRQANRAASQHNFDGCTSISMLTPNGLLIMMKSDDDKHGNYCFMVLMAPDGNGFFMQVQLAKLIPRILDLNSTKPLQRV